MAEHAARGIDADRLRMVMDDRMITVRDLAERCQISPDYASNIVNGHRTLKRNPALRRKIAAALGRPIDWIETSEVS